MVSKRTRTKTTSLQWLVIATLLLLTTAVLAWTALAGGHKNNSADSRKDQKEHVMNDADNRTSSDKVIKTDEEWKQILTPEQYRITRQGGTERAFTGKYNDFHEDGVFTCVACGQPLFDSDAKYNSGSGWPSFFKPYDSSKIEKIQDRSLGMMRVEVKCSRCEAHLGHVFDDGPEPTGLRYCINSAALGFKADNEADTSTDSAGQSGN